MLARIELTTKKRTTLQACKTGYSENKKYIKATQISSKTTDSAENNSTKSVAFIF